MPRCGPRSAEREAPEISYPGDFRWLLRLGGKAKRKEQSAKRKTKDFFIHDFLSFHLSLGIATRSAHLNHPIRPRQHIRRNRQADLLRRFEIDDKLELLRLFDGKISGLRAF